MNRTAYVLGALLLLACNGNGDGTAPPEDPIAADYAGYWQADSWTMMQDPASCSGSDCTVVVTPSSSPQAMRADVFFVADGTTRGHLDGKQAMLVGGLLGMPPQVLDIAVTLEPERRWYLTHADGHEEVFVASLDGDALTLSRDWDDARNPPLAPGEYAASEVKLSRVAPPEGYAIGSWTMASMTNDGTTVTPGACVAIGTDAWAQIGLDMDIDDRWLMQQQMTLDLFSDSSCQSLQQAQVMQWSGMVAEDGSTLHWWGVRDDNTSEYAAFTATTQGSNLELTFQSCLPTPDCETAPQTLVLSPRP